MQALIGKTALVTGAGKGIGRAIAMALANEGVNVGLLARTEEDLIVLAEDTKAKGVNAVILMADVSNISEVERAVKKTQKELGPIDILINNAGFAVFGKFLELDPAVWEKHLTINVLGTYFITRAVLPQMIQRKTGDIINISSTAGKTGSNVTSAYSASKFALFGLSESLMQEVRKHNIRVTALAPSTVVTELAKSSNLINGNPDNVMHPEDLAELIVSQLKLNRRIFVKEATIFSTNP